MTYKVFFAALGIPATGLSPSITTFKKVSDGSDVGSPPAITETGGGWYKFTYAPAFDIVLVIDGGATLDDSERYASGKITPEDDNISNLDVASSTLSTFDPLLDTVDVGEVGGNAVTGPDDLKADVSNLDVAVSTRSTFNHTANNVTVGALAAAAIKSIWDQLTATLTTAGSIGKLLVDFIDATISSRASSADLAGAVADGVIQSNFPVTDGGNQRIPRGDVATITINAPDWDLSGGKRLFFAMKEDKFDELGAASTKVNREATIVQDNPLIGTFTFTEEESDTVGKFDAEFRVTDADGATDPLTATRDFTVTVFQDVV